MIKKKVEVGGPLTNSELILMNILWDAQRPITGPEILAYVNASPEGPAFARTPYHAMVNNLLDKNYIISIGGCGHGKNQARKFIPALSRNEYYAHQLTSSKRFSPSDIPDLVCSLFSYSNVTSEEKEAILKSIDALVREDAQE